MLERLLFVLFGLEPAFWGSVDAAERRWFRLLLIFFGINSLVLLIGSITNMHLASSGWGWAIGAGLVLTYVFWSILRFAYLTIRLSPSEINQRIQQKANPENNKTGIDSNPAASIGARTLAIATDASTTIDPLTPLDSQPNSFLAVWKKWKGTAVLKNFNEYFRFGRWLLFLFVGLIVLTLTFPFSYFLVRSKADSLNKEWREQHLADWEKSEKTYFDRSQQLYLQKLNQLRFKRDSLQTAGFTNKDDYFQRVLGEIAHQEQQIEQRSKDFYDKFNTQKFYLTKRWEHRHFMLHLIGFIWQQPSTNVVLVVLSILFLAPLFLLMHLKNGASFRYFSDSATHFRDVIIAEHQQTQAEINQILNLKYSKSNVKILESIWADEPFNTQYSTQYVPKTEVPISNLG